MSIGIVTAMLGAALEVDARGRCATRSAGRRLSTSIGPPRIAAEEPVARRVDHDVQRPDAGADEEVGVGVRHAPADARQRPRRLSTRVEPGSPMSTIVLSPVAGLMTSSALNVAVEGDLVETDIEARAARPEAEHNATDRAEASRQRELDVVSESERLRDGAFRVWGRWQSRRRLDRPARRPEAAPDQIRCVASNSPASDVSVDSRPDDRRQREGRLDRTRRQMRHEDSPPALPTSHGSRRVPPRYSKILTSRRMNMSLSNATPQP